MRQIYQSAASANAGLEEEEEGNDEGNDEGKTRTVAGETTSKGFAHSALPRYESLLHAAGEFGTRRQQEETRGSTRQAAHAM